MKTVLPISIKRLALAGAAALTLASCASTGPATDDTATIDPATYYAGVLAYPERLQPSATDKGAYYWIDSKADFRKYNKLLVERIRVRVDPSSPAVDPAQLQHLTEYFHDAIAKSMEGAYTLVTEPGPDVLRVRITIVDLSATNTQLSVVTAVVPFAALPDLASGAAKGGNPGSPPYLGRTGIAAEFIDGASGHVVAEYADRRAGKKYDVDFSQGAGNAIDKGAKSYMDGFSTWGYAQQAFDYWARLMRTQLDRLKAR